MATELSGIAAVGLIPKESPASLKKGGKPITLGMPKETSTEEKRVVLSPEAVRILSQNGIEVLVETQAGERAKFSDQQFSDAGAKIAYSSKEVFAADVVVKVNAPTEEEIADMSSGACLISALQLEKQESRYIQALNTKKITALAFEYLEDKVGGMPVVRAMSEIAGSTVMLIASEYLSSVNEGKGLILGGITGVPPTQVVIIGAGTVAEYAARTALGLGANIKVFDNHLYKLRRIKQLLGQQIATSTIDNASLSQALAEADVVIGALRAEKGRNKIVITEEMVAKMIPGSVVIDVGIDQGGCIETARMTTHENPVYRTHDVIHYCVPNIPSLVSKTSSLAISNLITSFVLKTGKTGGIEEMLWQGKSFMKGVYCYKGHVTHPLIGKLFKKAVKDIQLLLMN